MAEGATLQDLIQAGYVPPPAAPDQPPAAPPANLLGNSPPDAPGGGLLDRLTSWGTFAPLLTGGLVRNPGTLADGTTAPLPPQDQADTMRGLLAFGRSMMQAGAPSFGPKASVGLAAANALADAGGEVMQNRQQTTQLAMQQLQYAQQLRNLQMRESAFKAFGDMANRATGGAASGGGAAGGGGGAAAGPAPGPGMVGWVPGANIQGKLGDAEGHYTDAPPTGLDKSGKPLPPTLGRYQFLPALATDSGFYKPAAPQQLASLPGTAVTPQGPWAGQFSIPGFDSVKTMGDFLGNPQAQDAAYLMAMQHNHEQAQKLGLYSHVGRVINGTTVTPDGILAGMWLGGAGGTKNWLESNGTNDAQDGNGTPISKWVGLGAQVANPAGPPGSQPPQPQQKDLIPPEVYRTLQARVGAGDLEGALKAYQEEVSKRSLMPQWRQATPAEQGETYRPGQTVMINQFGELKTVDPSRSAYVNPSTPAGAIDPRVQEAYAPYVKSVQDADTFKLWQQGKQRFDAVQAALAQNNTPGSIAAAMSLHKIFDPNVQASGGADDAWLGGVGGYLREQFGKYTGIDKMPPEVKQQIMNLAQAEMATRDAAVMEQLHNARGNAASALLPNQPNAMDEAKRMILPTWKPAAITADDLQTTGKKNEGGFTLADPVTYDAQSGTIVRGDAARESIKRMINPPSTVTPAPTPPAPEQDAQGNWLRVPDDALKEDPGAYLGRDGKIYVGQGAQRKQWVRKP